MNNQLPDITVTESSNASSPLNWVGMQNIDLPIWIQFSGITYNAAAKVGVQVNLPKFGVKGIHMSRLYQKLNELSDGKPLTPSRLNQLLHDMLKSHQDCYSDHVRLTFKFSLIVQRPALVTKELKGWKQYPMEIVASLIGGQFQLQTKVSIEYSSTCPCSAALSRHHIKETFLEQFSGALEVSEVAAWLKENASLATPHSQRSRANITLLYSDVPDEFEFLGVIERIEKALGTPLQTAVKRVDEQAFAELNGQNLMFVEDAIRRIQAVLTKMKAEFSIEVQHFESLHPHDAVAFTQSPGFNAY